MNKYFYLGLLPLHIFGLLAVVNYSSINIWLVLLFYILLSGYGVGVTLHRLLSHKAFETNAKVKDILSLISCFCIQGSPIFWVNIHRGLHHRYSDTDKDIHSPVHGKLNAYFLWACKVDTKNISYRYVPDLLRSKFQLFLSDYYFTIIWLGWILSYLISPTLFYSLVIGQLITVHLEFCVNLFCHIDNVPFAYRNFETKDKSKNYWLFGLLCWGIGYHNNHHYKPNDYNFGHTKREFDPTILLVKTVKKNV